MYDILTLNKISKTGLERFTDEYQYGDAVENPQGIMVRSASMHEMEMLSLIHISSGTLCRKLGTFPWSLIFPPAFCLSPLMSAGSACCMPALRKTWAPPA